MAHPTKVSIPVAASNRSNFTLDIPHVTTSNFMEFGISFAKEYVPKSKWNLSQETFMRLEPMPVPTFGEAEVKHRAFFVPFRTVFPAFIDFSEGTPHVYNNGESSIPQFVPVLYDQDITSMFIDETIGYATMLSAEDSSNPNVKADFSVDVSGMGQGNWSKFNLTPLGRRVYKMFVSLGMKFTFSTSSRGFVSALPLFCAARIYLDWYYTSQYAHTSGYTAIQKYLIKNDDVVDVGESFVPYDDLANICTTLSTIFYEPDYFTAAWDNPLGPNHGLQSGITIPDITGVETESGYASSVNTTRSETNSPLIVTDSSYGISGISSYMLTAVKKVSDYLKRNQLAGARALDRFYARFGIQIPAEALNRSYLVGEFSHYIQFGDVTSMASTDSATLGDYAGKGVTFGNGNFEFSGNERGYFIVITSIIPKTYYYQGVDRMAQHVTKLDFWTEEFDGLGVQALSKAEVYKPQDSRTDSMITDDYDNKVFGFVPRYAEYKTSSAILSGDYILRSRNVGKDAWTLFRNVRPDHDEPLDEFKHDIFFVQGLDANQYNRIFYNTTENADHFNVIHQFRLKVSFPGKSLYDTYEFDNEENSQRVEMGIGGTQLS